MSQLNLSLRRIGIRFLTGFLFVLFLLPGVANAVFYLSPFERVGDSAWFYITGAPGETVTAQFWVVNDEETDETFALKLTDAHIDDQGKFSSDSSYEDLGAWGTLSNNLLDVAAKTATLSEVTFNVPEETPIGEYWGLLVVSKSDPVTSKDSPKSSTITTRIEQGLRTRLTVIEPEKLETIDPASAPNQAIVLQEKNNSFLLYILSGLILILGAIITAVFTFRNKSAKK